MNVSRDILPAVHRSGKQLDYGDTTQRVSVAEQLAGKYPDDCVTLEPLDSIQVLMQPTAAAAGSLFASASLFHSRVLDDTKEACNGLTLP